MASPGFGVGGTNLGAETETPKGVARLAKNGREGQPPPRPPRGLKVAS